MNRDPQQYLHLFTAEKQHEWVIWLPIAQFSYNTKKQASTQKSLFEVTRSYSPRMGFEQRITKAPAVERFTTIMQNTLAQTKANLEKAQERMKAQVDKHRSIAFAGYDQRPLHMDSRDMTTFNSPLRPH